MTLNGVIAFILLYFTEFDSSAGLLYVTVIEGRPILFFRTRCTCISVTVSYLQCMMLVVSCREIAVHKFRIQAMADYHLHCSPAIRLYESWTLIFVSLL